MAQPPPPQDPSGVPQGTFPQSLPAGMTQEAYQKAYMEYYAYYVQAMQQQQAMAQHQAMAQQQQMQMHQQHAPPSGFGGYGPPSAMQPPPPAAPPAPLPELVPPPPEQISTNCLWVGYPAQSVSEEELRPVFAQFGPIDNIRAIVQKNCAFVTFKERQSAWMCINTLQRSPVTIRGFTFRLGWGKPTEQLSVGGTSGLPVSAPSNCLWLGSVNFDLSEDELGSAFARFGKIENIRLLPAKKCAFITFSNVAEAELALREMQGQVLRGERLKINFGHGGTATKKDEEIRIAPVPEVGPPPNRDVAMVIEQLAAFVHRLGVAFEEKVKDLQKDNPRFEFLFGGVGNDYYEWKKYDLKEKETLANSNLAPWQRVGGTSVADQIAVVLSGADQHQLNLILEHLQPTQESIRDAKDWIMARARLSSDIVGVFKSKMPSLPGFAPRLHLLYLVNDVLLHSGRAQQDYFGPALQRHIADLCVVACDPQIAGPADVKRVLDLVDIWINKQFYSKDFLEDVKRKVKSATEEEAPSKKQKSDPWAY